MTDSESTSSFDESSDEKNQDDCKLISLNPQTDDLIMNSRCSSVEAGEPSSTTIQKLNDLENKSIYMNDPQIYQKTSEVSQNNELENHIKSDGKEHDSKNIITLDITNNSTINPSIHLKDGFHVNNDKQLDASVQLNVDESIEKGCYFK